MATKTGSEAADLMECLRSDPKRFTLEQALRLLGHIYSPDAWDTFIDDNIHIRPWLSLAFPSTELTELTESNGRFTLTATNIGLYSTLGPLPTLYTEELLEEARADESVTRDFLDILNNHLAHLRFRANRHNCLESRSIENRNPQVNHVQFCLMGELPGDGTEGLPRTFLTRILAQRTRSAGQLERYLDCVLNRNDVRVEQCIERRPVIMPNQRLLLGQANARLGYDTVLGQCVFDSTGCFRIHFDSVDHSEMQHYLPGHEGHRDLAGHLARFLDTPLEYELTLHPRPVTPDPCVLGVESGIGVYLGSPKTLLPVRVFWKQSALFTPSRLRS